MTKLFHSSVDSAIMDPEYAALLRPEYEELRDFIESQWVRFEHLADPNFHNRFQVNFSERFWELYLACSLMDNGFQLSSSAKGPDIRTMLDDLVIWIEAIAPKSGSGNDRIEQALCGLSTSVTDAKIILRLTSAIDKKFKMYQSYRQDNIIAENDPYVIAINASSIPCIRLESSIPRVLSAVFPIGNENITFDPQNLKLVSQGFSYRGGIAKKKGTVIPTTIFLNPDFSGISGILYSTSTIWDLKLDLGRFSYFVHNPMASNPLPRGWLKCGTEFWVENGYLHNVDH